MKSINLPYSHKELQFQMFAAFTFGLRYSVKKGYFITFHSTDDSFVWQLYKSASAPENRDSQELFAYSINKGDYQMNDVRLCVMSKYLEDNAWKFFQEMPDQIRKECSMFPTERLR